MPRDDFQVRKKISSSQYEYYVKEFNVIKPGTQHVLRIKVEEEINGSTVLKTYDYPLSSTPTLFKTEVRNNSDHFFVLLESTTNVPFFEWSTELLLTPFSQRYFGEVDDYLGLSIIGSDDARMGLFKIHTGIGENSELGISYSSGRIKFAYYFPPQPQ